MDYFQITINIRWNVSFPSITVFSDILVISMRSFVGSDFVWTTSYLDSDGLSSCSHPANTNIATTTNKIADTFFIIVPPVFVFVTIIFKGFKIKKNHFNLRIFDATAAAQNRWSSSRAT